jgi:hypothetical protein
MDPMINENTLPSFSDLSELEQLQSIYWDAFKDAHGVRPRGIETSAWTVQDFEVALVSLGEIADRAEAVRRAGEAAAVEVLEARIGDLRDIGAGDRATALAWIAEAEGAQNDMEYLCFLLGLPYGYFK